MTRYYHPWGNIGQTLWTMQTQRLCLLQNSGLQIFSFVPWSKSNTTARTQGRRNTQVANRIVQPSRPLSACRTSRIRNCAFTWHGNLALLLLLLLPLPLPLLLLLRLLLPDYAVREATVESVVQQNIQMAMGIAIRKVSQFLPWRAPIFSKTRGMLRFGTSALHRIQIPM